MRRAKLRCPYYGFAKRRDRVGIAAIGDSRHQMQALDGGRLHIWQRRLETLLEIGKTIRQRCVSPFAVRPVAGRQIEQRLCQFVLAQPLADLTCGIIVGKQKLDGRETRSRCSLEAIEERYL